jgi:hypothetical protein
VQVLLSIRIEILGAIDAALVVTTDLDTAVDIEKVARAEELMWLWVLGAYEVVRTMTQAKSCFSSRTHGALASLKHELAAARMPAAKMERLGKSIPITSYRCPCGIDAANRDLLIGDPENLVSARSLLSHFSSFIAQVSQTDVVGPHEASYGGAS